MAMSHSVRKPSGRGLKGYVTNAHWLTTEFPNKMVAVEQWDDIKITFSQKPLHENIGTPVVGVTEFTMKAVLEAVNGHGWYTSMYGREAGEADIVFLSKEIIEVYKVIIKQRQDEYAASVKVQGRRSARKRLRMDDADAGAADAGAADDMDTEAVVALDSPLHAAFSPIDEGDEEEHEKESGEVVDDQSTDANDQSTNSTWGDDAQTASISSEWQSKMLKMESMLKDTMAKAQYIDNLAEQVFVLQKSAFQMDSVILNNVKFDTANIDRITSKVKDVFKDIGMEKEAENIKRCITIEHGNKLKIIFKSWKAAMYVLTQSDRFAPRYWTDKKGAAAIVAKMASMRRTIVGKDKGQLSNGGYMFTSPALLRHDRGGAAAAATATATTNAW